MDIYDKARVLIRQILKETFLNEFENVNDEFEKGKEILKVFTDGNIDNTLTELSLPKNGQNILNGEVNIHFVVGNYDCTLTSQITIYKDDYSKNEYNPTDLYAYSPNEGEVDIHNFHVDKFDMLDNSFYSQIVEKIKLFADERLRLYF